MNLKAENISFSYNKKRQILKDISLSINSNEIIGLIGDSGSGKSTLCKILSGYITNYSGCMIKNIILIKGKIYFMIISF